MSEIAWFTLVAIGLYFFADWLLDRIERLRGKRFEENRPLVYFAIILPLAVASFWMLRMLSGGP